MEFRYAFCVVLEAHLPFGDEDNFFESITETLLPLLEVLDRLENDHVYFRLGLAVSPVIINMLEDENLQNKYLQYIDRQIEFGKKEIERKNKLAEFYYNKFIDRRIAYTERYGKNLLRAFDFYRRRGKLEILASCATHAFLPFFAHNNESIQAQMEIPVSSYRRNFCNIPQGFWLPCLGWTCAAEPFFRAYNFSYTIIESHGLLFGNPPLQNGTFFPAKTPGGTYLLARDFYTVREIEKISANDAYRNNNIDAGYELPSNLVKDFLTEDGERRRTGYKYHGNTSLYDPKAACEKVKEHTRGFLEKTIARLEEASKHMKETPVCLYANNADYFGRLWYEGPQFLESLFRMASGYRDFHFVTPGEYIFKQEPASIPVTTPEFSSCGVNGYAQTWLDGANDKMYRHLYRALERMTELAERFPDDTGLKERALNQAAREILLAQASDLPSLYSREQVENSLRNFTTIYEALGSNYISTEWLTNLEKRHNLFPNINYRVFRKKR